ncbi:MAG: hypothetical protein HY046_07300 [Acidobacteria bacterium]|nr:hypothetical protein [Acidobacteriota bacterium]
MKTSLRSLAIVLLLTFVLAPAFLLAADKPEIMPLKDVRPGMKGYARTIFAGEEIETMELEVIGILPSLLGPKADIILVQLKGAKPDFTGVAAGMSGSPVYIDGKLVGALSLKFGIFTREAIGGVTPIENMIEVNVPDNRSLKAQNSSEFGNPDAAIAVNSLPSQVHYPISGDFVQKLGGGSSAFLSPIETPLVFSGFQQAVLARYADQFAGLGVTATSGGTVPPQPDDNRIEPGSMVGMVLMQGDLSLVAGCTVTAIINGKVYVCGHPFFGHGEVEMPMSRGHMVTTLASTFASTKIMNSGGVIGTFTQDRLTAVMGHLGEGPKLIPVELIVVGEGGEKKFTFEVFEHPKFTPLLVGIAAFNGLISSTAYSEGMTFKLTGGTGSAWEWRSRIFSRGFIQIHTNG